MTAPDPLACALIVILAMSAAGLAHTGWMRSRLASRWRLPIDAGMHWRGKRIFGDNKTVAGFVAMVPASGAAFALLGLSRDLLPAWLGAGIWPLAPVELFALGCWAGFWFMAGELPNSFVKRRLGVAPGAVPAQGLRRLVCLVIDRLDSIVALLIALSVLVPLSWVTWLLVLLAGPLVHFGFSAALYFSGVKARLA
jgi:CDP-2,3-bis-(O-geranylgeranyl)-sn-glycerol synthase